MVLFIILSNFESETAQSTKERETVMNEERNELKQSVSTAIDIARHIIAFCNDQEEPVPVSNIKLQKLLYLVFGYFCLDSNVKLFSDAFQAWQYGPAVAEVYDQFCAFSGSYIYLTDAPPVLPEEITASINPTIEKNMRRDVFELVEETHQPGSAWAKAMERRGASKSPDILFDDIIEEFRKRRDENGAASAL